MKSVFNPNQVKKVLQLRIENAFQDLINFKKEKNIASFNERLLKILPDVKKYINGRLDTAILKGHFIKNKYKADDIIDQLFIEVYDHIDTVEKEKDFYLWLFKKTNNILDDLIVEEEFDDFFFQNIDDYSKPEWDEMAEKFSTDADGDLLMIEELDDNSYNHHDYTLNHVFIEDHENEFIYKIDTALSEKDINRHINMVLYNLPMTMHTIFDLFTKQRFTIAEIAEITNTNTQKVEALLKDAKRAIKVSLLNRNFITQK